jgi:hypothetical protein
MNQLETAKILAAALKLAESQTRKEVQKLREELDLREVSFAEKLDKIESTEGPSGEKGDRGFIGQTGSQGVQGEQGILGEQGIQGEEGLQGIQGDQGIQGKQGIQGDRGIQGEQGIQGIQGEEGVHGEQGIKGDQGIQGEQGVQGDQGSEGEQGKIGSRGERGITGDLGPIGKSGKDGKNGKDGKDGIAGKKGDRGDSGQKGDKGDKGDSGSDADVAPLEKKFEQLTKTVETKISRIAYSAATGHSAGSGEVNLKYLDDVDLNSVDSATNGQVLVYNSTLRKWQANTSGGSSSNSFTTTITTRSIIPEANNLYNLGSSSRRWKDLWLSGNTIQLGDTIIKSDANGGISTARAPAPGSNATITFVPLRGANVASYLQVANAVATYQTKAVERATLANTNTYIGTKASSVNPATSGLLAHTGRATISTNLTVSGNTSLSRLILSNVLSTQYGGTGLNSVTTNGILFGANSSILGYLTGTSGQILQIDSGGIPKFDQLDGGTF